MFQIKLVEKIKTHILCLTNPLPENRAVCEISVRNIVQPDRPRLNPLNPELNPTCYLLALFVCCECRVLSGRGLCDELITRPEESYRLCCVVVCDLETSKWLLHIYI